MYVVVGTTYLLDLWKLRAYGSCMLGILPVQFITATSAISPSCTGSCNMPVVKIWPFAFGDRPPNFY